MTAPLLRVTDLRAHFIGFRGQRAVKAVDGVSFSLQAGETLGLVGESGSGKTTACHAMFRLLPPGGEIIGGSVEFDGEDLMRKSPRDMRRIRGRNMAMILQDPMASLNPHRVLVGHLRVGPVEQHEQRDRGPEGEDAEHDECAGTAPTSVGGPDVADGTELAGTLA